MNLLRFVKIGIRYLTIIICAVGFISLPVLSSASGRYGLPLIKAEKAGMSTERLARIKNTMLGFVTARELPNAVTTVARNGKIVHFETVGYMDVEKSIPVKADTIFRLHSQTKPVTGVAAMMLFEEGLFSLDDPIAKYLPEFSDMQVLLENKDGAEVLVKADPITIRQLMLHTSGISSGRYANERLAQKHKNSAPTYLRVGITSEEYIKRLTEIPLSAQPGSKWIYGASTSVLSRLVEVLSSQRFGEFCKQRIFEPLGMNDTDFHVPATKVHRLASLYIEQPDGTYLLADVNTIDGDYGKRPSLELGASGLAGTIADYMRFAQMLANGGELDGVRLLSPSTVGLIMANHLPEKLIGSFAKGEGHGLTVSVVVDHVAAGKASPNGQFGWGGAAGTTFSIDPENNIVSMVFTQVLYSSSAYRHRFNQMVYQALIEE
jgi:CubicO group peptidase (beta-lactamase class C family)